MKTLCSCCYFIKEGNAKLVKQLREGFKRPVYWNKYKVIDNKVVQITDANVEIYIREMLDSSYQGVKRLFLLMIIQQVIIKFLLVLINNIYFHKQKLKTTILKLM